MSAPRPIAPTDLSDARPDFAALDALVARAFPGAGAPPGGLARKEELYVRAVGDLAQAQHALSKFGPDCVVASRAFDEDLLLWEGSPSEANRGAIVTMGPRAPELDGAMRPLDRPLDVSGFEIEPLDDMARADVLVARRIDELGLPMWPTDPVDAHVAVHEDERGAPRVVMTAEG